MTSSARSLTTPQLVAGAYSTLAIGYGIRALVAPIPFTKEFGFPQTPGTPRNPFVTATGGRTAALGVAVMAFAAQGNTKASGTVLLACVLSGLSDTLNGYVSHNIKTAVKHGLGTVALGSVGWYLYNT